MLNFLARLMGLMVVGIFFLALGFFILSSYLGFDFSEKLALENASKNVALADSNYRTLDSSFRKAEKLGDDELQMLLSANQEAEISEVLEVQSLMQSATDYKDSYEVMNQLSLSQLANYLKTGEKVLVLLDNSVLESPMYNSSDVVMTEVLSVDGKVVETKEYGMYINSRYIYPINDFVEAFMSAGQIAVKL